MSTISDNPVNPREEVATRVGKIYNQSPWMSPAATLSLAKGNASDQAVDVLSDQAAKNYGNYASSEKKTTHWALKGLGFLANKASFIGKLIDKTPIAPAVKGALRYTELTMRTIPDIVQGSISDIRDDNGNVDGWWASTPLGVALDNPELLGDGYFEGEKTREIQAEKARKRRGEINGSAYTIGRDAANQIFVPGSQPYNILSGIIDGFVTVFTDPTSAAGKIIKQSRIAKNVIPDASDLKASGVLSDLVRGVDLGTNNQYIFDESKFGKLMNSRMGRRITDAYVAETDPLRIIENSKNKIDYITAMQLANAKTSQEVLGIIGKQAVRLSDELGQGLLFPESLKYIKTPGVIQRNAPESLKLVAERIPLARNIRRKWLSTVPPDQISFMGTANDKTQTIISLSNYLKRNGFNPYLDGDDIAAQNVMKKAFRVVDNKQSGYAIKKLMFDVDDGASQKDGLFALMLRKSGIEQEQIVAALKDVQEGIDKIRNYHVARTGEVLDTGLLGSLDQMGLIDSKMWSDFNTVPGEIGLISPGAIVEMLDRSIILPDSKIFDELTRLKNSPKFRNPDAKVQSQTELAKRPFVDTLDLVQQTYWKPLALATGGYVLRNSLDFNLRALMGGMSNVFTHPLHYFQILSHRRMPGTFNEGLQFNFVDDELDDIEEIFGDLQQFHSLRNTGAHHQVEQIAGKDVMKDGSVTVVSRSRGETEQHTTGIIDNLKRIKRDPLMGLLAKVLHLPLQNQIKIVESLIYNNPNIRQQLVELLNNGLRGTDNAGNQATIYINKNADLLDNRELAEIFTNHTRLKIEEVIGIGGTDNPLVPIAKYGVLPMAGETSFVIGAGDELYELAKQATKLDSNIFSISRTGVDSKGNLILTQEVYGIELIDDYYKLSSNGAEFRVLRLKNGESVLENSNDLGPADLREYIDNAAQITEQGIDGAAQMKFLPDSISYVNRTLSDEQKGFFDRAVRSIFGEFYGKRVVLQMEKSPVFRQYYYRAAAENAELLSQREAQKLLDNIRTYSATAASERGSTIVVVRGKPKKWSNLTEREKMIVYVGNEKTLTKMEQAALPRKPGVLILSSGRTGTVEQLQDYASKYALRKTEELLFDATSKNNMQEAFRIISPFNAAWAEVLTTYAKFFVEDPTRVIKAQRVFNAGVNAKFDENGDGFFFKDPASGEYKFTIPGSQQLVNLALQLPSDSGISFTAPLKGLSVGLGFSPGVGPLVQIAASKLLPDVPDMNFARKILLPYGGTFNDATDLKNSSLVPGWIKKGLSAITADKTDLSGVFGQTFTDTLRYLAASGKYDRSNIEDSEKLLKDATSKARWLTVFRALSQFAGPAAGAPTYEVKVNNDTVYSSFLIKEFAKLKENNYDTAVAEFLKLYGDDASIYVSSKTKAVDGGLETSEEFGNFELNNKGLFSTYPDVAGYLGPTVEGFSQSVFGRQVDAGKRKYQSAEDIIASAELKVGSSLYRAARLKAGKYPAANQRLWLANYRVRLNKEYPGFPVKASFDPGRFPNTVVALQKLVDDPRTANNRNAISIKQYLAYREQARQKLFNVGLSDLKNAKAAQPLRDWLQSKAAELMRENPGFQRVYDRELSAELED